MKKILWFLLGCVVLSFAPVSAMDPSPVLPEYWYKCNAREIYSFDGEIFYERVEGKIFPQRMCQERQPIWGIKPKYYEHGGQKYYTYNDSRTCYDYQGQEIAVNVQAPRQPSPQREKSTIKLKNPRENESTGFFKILAEANDHKEKDLVSALRKGCKILIIEVTNQSRDLVWLAGVLTFEPLKDVEQIIIRKQNEADEMPGFMEFIAFNETLKNKKYSGKLEVRVIKHSSEVAAFFDLIKKTEIDLVLEGYFNSSDIAGMVLAMNDARKHVPTRKNIYLRLLKPSDEHGHAIETFNNLAPFYKIAYFINDSVAMHTSFQFGLQINRRNSAKRRSFGKSGRGKSQSVIVKK